MRAAASQLCSVSARFWSMGLKFWGWMGPHNLYLFTKDDIGILIPVRAKPKNRTSLWGRPGLVYVACPSTRAYSGHVSILANGLRSCRKQYARLAQNMRKACIKHAQDMRKTCARHAQEGPTMRITNYPGQGCTCC